MEKLSQAQINAQFKRLLDAYLQVHIREVNRCASIPVGYGMRAYSRLKHSSSKSDEYRDKIEAMLEKYPIDHWLLSDAVSRRIVSAFTVNELQGTKF